MLTPKHFSGPWHQHPIAVIDFETTGADPATCAPVEMAIVRFEKGEAVGRWSTLFNPGVRIPPEATEVHGITDADVRQAPRISELPALLLAARALLRDAIPCGYNGQAFDRVVLHRHTEIVAAHNSIWPVLTPDFPWLDPLVTIRHIDKYVRGKGRHTLGATCARHGIALSDGHRALADAEATGRLLFNSRVRRALRDLPIADVLQTQLSRAEEQHKAFQAWLQKQPRTDNG